MRKSLTLVAVVTTAIGALTGCGSASGNSGAPSSSTAAGATGATSTGAAAGFPVSIPSAIGTATISKAPSRVVTLGWGSNDAALALGVVPVGMSSQVPESGGVTSWAKARITALKGQQPQVFTDADNQIPYETIAALHPDVILAVYSGVTADQYTKLSAIAPTVGYPGKPWSTPWTTQITTIGKALGKTSEADALVTRTQARIVAAAKAHPEFKGLTAIFGSGTKPGGYNFYLADDPRMQLLGELGFTVSTAATTTFTHGADSPDFATSVSLEQIDKLKADVLVAWYLSPETRSGIESASVFQQLGPVKDKAYVPITDDNLVFATSAPNVLSIPYMLDTYVPKLAVAAKAAKGAGA